MITEFLSRDQLDLSSLLASNSLSKVGKIESLSLLNPRILAASRAADWPDILSLSLSSHAEFTLVSQSPGNDPESSLFDLLELPVEESPLLNELTTDEERIIRGATLF